MKTAEELNALKEEIETLNKKLAELSEEEIEQVAGGGGKIDYLLYLLKCTTPGCTWSGWVPAGEHYRGLFYCPNCRQQNFIILEAKQRGHP